MPAVDKELMTTLYSYECLYQALGQKLPLAMPWAVINTQA